MPSPPKYPAWEATFDYRESGPSDFAIESHTGLFGVLVLMSLALLHVVVFLFSSLFVLLGAAEVVCKGPMCYRIRWRRQ